MKGGWKERREQRWRESFSAGLTADADNQTGHHPLMALADSEQSELRVRAEKAEAELAERREVILRLDKEIDSWIDREERVFTQREALKAELRALRDGIQALADEWAGTALHGCSAALRGLLSPTPEGPTT